MNPLCLNWWQLRSVGNLTVLKVSYLSIVGLPFVIQLLEYLVEMFPSLERSQWMLATSFLAVLLVATAGLVYDIFCPTIVKQFPSPNDLYERMLGIKALSNPLYPLDDFDASISHCKSAYNSTAFSQVPARIVCSSCLMLASVSLLVVLGNRILVVLAALGVQSCF